MRKQSPITGTGRKYGSFLLTVLFLVPVMFLSACTSTSSVQLQSSVAEAHALPISYSIVYVIHGDGGYLYHDSDGAERLADEQALFGAKAVAETNTEAEVFIFHEKRRRPFLKRIFSRSDGEFLYYRHGRLSASQAYRRSDGATRFGEEVALHEQFRSKQAVAVSKVFLYFGHEIPEFGGIGYDASYKKRSFTVADLADGLSALGPDSSKFDLVILSTCFNGTPHTISALAPYARYVIASPDNLHLSYFDAKPLEHLDSTLVNDDIGEFANTFAKRSFDRLSSDVQTAITVAVYDIDQVKTYVRAVDSMYVGTLATIDQKASSPVEHYDCADNPAFALPGMGDGVNIYHRPARFGRDKLKQGHSGWQCVGTPTVASVETAR